MASAGRRGDEAGADGPVHPTVDRPHEAGEVLDEGARLGVEAETRMTDSTAAPGSDTLNGGPGTDRLRGENGDDVLDSVGFGLDAVLDGGRGDDHLIGTDGWDHYLYGGPGDDLIEGFGDGDRLYGGPGNDTLDGGTGTDKGRGDDGQDTCISIEHGKDCENPAASRRRTHAYASQTPLFEPEDS